MTIRVVYASKTNHTAKVAQAIAEALGVNAEHVAKARPAKEVDFLFVGSGIYANKVASELDDYLTCGDWNSIGQVVVFSTNLTGEDATQRFREKLKERGANVLDRTFACKGKFLFFNRKRPNEEDLSRARTFAQSIVGQ
ncbi:MAG: flavodoxin family protein [Christensenellales bacterium]